MIYEKTVVLSTSFAEALDQVKEAFAAEGFETLNEIDMQVMLKRAEHKDIGRFAIVSVCNPGIAQRALDVDFQLGVLLPCNIVVREFEDDVLVEVMNPGLMASVTGIEEMRPVANDARHLVHEAMSRLDVASFV